MALAWDPAFPGVKRTSPINRTCNKESKTLLMNCIVFNPCMSYSGLKDEFKNDIDLSSHLEILKDDLHKHYQDYYAPPVLSQPSLQPSVLEKSKASPQKNFISKFNHKPHTSLVVLPLCMAMISGQLCLNLF